MDGSVAMDGGMGGEPVGCSCRVGTTEGGGAGAARWGGWLLGAAAVAAGRRRRRGLRQGTRTAG